MKNLRDDLRSLSEFGILSHRIYLSGISSLDISEGNLEMVSWLRKQHAWLHVVCLHKNEMKVDAWINGAVFPRR